jgi:hypothetical protein
LFYKLPTNNPEKREKGEEIDKEKSNIKSSVVIRFRNWVVTGSS